MSVSRVATPRRVRFMLTLLVLALSALSAGRTAQSIPATPPTGQSAQHFQPQYPVFTYVRPARTSPKAAPSERVLFTLEGSHKVSFTLRQLQALPAVRYATFHPQLRRTYTYEGVTLRDLAIKGGFAGKDLRVYASNNFVSIIKAEDYLYTPIMLAYKADDQPIPVLQKGPLTVVLPGRPERFHTPAYSAAWVWFAVRLAPASPTTP